MNRRSSNHGNINTEVDASRTGSEQSDSWCRVYQRLTSTGDEEVRGKEPLASGDRSVQVNVVEGVQDVDGPLRLFVAVVPRKFVNVGQGETAVAIRICSRTEEAYSSNKRRECTKTHTRTPRKHYKKRMYVAVQNVAALYENKAGDNNNNKVKKT